MLAEDGGIQKGHLREVLNKAKECIHDLRAQDREFKHRLAKGERKKHKDAVAKHQARIASLLQPQHAPTVGFSGSVSPYSIGFPHGAPNSDTENSPKKPCQFVCQLPRLGDSHGCAAARAMASNSDNESSPKTRRQIACQLPKLAESRACVVKGNMVAGNPVSRCELVKLQAEEKHVAYRMYGETCRLRPVQHKVHRRHRHRKNVDHQLAQESQQFKEGTGLVVDDTFEHIALKPSCNESLNEAG